MVRRKKAWSVKHSRGQGRVYSVSREGALRQAENRGYKNISLKLE